MKDRSIYLQLLDVTEAFNNGMWAQTGTRPVNICDKITLKLDEGPLNINARYGCCDTIHGYVEMFADRPDWGVDPWCGAPDREPEFISAWNAWGNRLTCFMHPDFKTLSTRAWCRLRDDSNDDMHDMFVMSCCFWAALYRTQASAVPDVHVADVVQRMERLFADKGLGD